MSFRASEAITVKDGLIWRVNEYASLVHEQPNCKSTGTQRPAVSRLGLSPRQLSFMADDLQQYFQRQQPYLDPELDLQRVAQGAGTVVIRFPICSTRCWGRASIATSTRHACSTCLMH